MVTSVALAMPVTSINIPRIVPNVFTNSSQLRNRPSEASRSTAVAGAVAGAVIDASFEPPIST
jgi:hypothetical protein